MVSQIFAGCAPDVFPAGKSLFMQDDPPERIYGLLSGTVEISILSPEGDKLVANLVQPPSLIGEIGCLDGAERTASAICRTACSIVSLSRAQLLDRLERDPKLSLAVIAFLCRRLRWVSSELGDQTFLDIESRLAKRLLMLSQTLAGKDGWIAISQSELAQTLGATRESINKTLNDWRSQGLIDIKRGQLKLVNGPALRTLTLE